MTFMYVTQADGTRHLTSIHNMRDKKYVSKKAEKLMKKLVKVLEKEEKNDNNRQSRN